MAVQRSSCLSLFAVAILVAASLEAAEFTVEKTDRGATVKLDGQLFTEYLIKSGNKPVLWPIIAPGGKQITRGYPIEPRPGETSDHIHQRGLWCTHGDVNGVVFWNQEPGSGEMVHREFTKLAGGKKGTISARNDWLAPDGKKVCSDTRTYIFDADDAARWIDAEVILEAGDHDVRFGDNKEGSFGLRIADSMRVEAKQGGAIVNNKGQANESAWGQPAEWVDCHGPVEGETLGVAILQHPSSFAFPTRWHVRTYGLFAANPFTRKAFDASQPEASHTVPAGKSIPLRFRVVFHKGDEKEGKIAERFADYSKS